MAPEVLTQPLEQEGFTIGTRTCLLRTKSENAKVFATTFHRLDKEQAA